MCGPRLWYRNVARFFLLLVPVCLRLSALVFLFTHSSFAPPCCSFRAPLSVLLIRPAASPSPAHTCGCCYRVWQCTFLTSRVGLSNDKILGSSCPRSADKLTTKL